MRRKESLRPKKPIPRHRSAVANGTRLFVEALDERSAYGRRYKGLVYDIASDIGGIETLTELKLALVRRAASIIIEIERLESALARGDEGIDVDLLGRLTGHLRRLSETLGLDRVTRDVTPTLADIIAQSPATSRRQEKPASAPETIEAAILPAQPIEPVRDLPGPPTAPSADVAPVATAASIESPAASLVPASIEPPIETPETPEMIETPETIESPIAAPAEAAE